MHRLFVGPKMTKDDAIKTKLIIDKQLKVDARIYPYKP
jgi:hypothetical protein